MTKCSQIEYKVWDGMRQRCNNPNSPDYPRYGGRGITICERWSASFSNFVADMGPRLSRAFQIERRDNDLGYSPENCRWATRKEQQRNRRNTRFIEFNGERLSVPEWSERTGIERHTLYLRIRRGWTPQQTLTIPADSFAPVNRPGWKCRSAAEAQAAIAAYLNLPNQQ